METLEKSQREKELHDNVTSGGKQPSPMDTDGNLLLEESVILPKMVGFEFVSVKRNRIHLILSFYRDESGH